MIRAKVSGSLPTILDAERRRVARALREGVEKSAREVRGELRAQVRAGGFRRSRPLENAWREKTYPANRAQPSLKPAAIIYSQAPEIHKAHDEAPTINAKGGKYLAFPTGFNTEGGRRNAGRRGGVRVSPQAMVELGGFLVRFKNGRGYLWCLRPSVVTGTSRRGRKRTQVFAAPGLQVLTGNVKGRAARIAEIAAQRFVPMWILVRSVTLKKRTNIAEVRQRAPATLARNIVSALRSSPT